MRKGKEEQVRKWCEDNGLQPLNIRNNKIKCGKTVIIVTLKCKQCGERYDRHWDNLKKQKFPWMCTKCAHILRNKNFLGCVLNVLTKRFIKC